MTRRFSRGNRTALLVSYNLTEGHFRLTNFFVVSFCCSDTEGARLGILSSTSDHRAPSDKQRLDCGANKRWAFVSDIERHKRENVRGKHCFCEVLSEMWHHLRSSYHDAKPIALRNYSLDWEGCIPLFKKKDTTRTAGTQLTSFWEELQSEFWRFLRWGGARGYCRSMRWMQKMGRRYLTCISWFLFGWW